MKAPTGRMTSVMVVMKAISGSDLSKSLAMSA